MTHKTKGEAGGVEYADAEYIDSGTFQASEEEASRAGLTRIGSVPVILRLAVLEDLLAENLRLREALEGSVTALEVVLNEFRDAGTAKFYRDALAAARRALKGEK